MTWAVTGILWFVVFFALMCVKHIVALTHVHLLTVILCVPRNPSMKCLIKAPENVYAGVNNPSTMMRRIWSPSFNEDIVGLKILIFA